MGFWSKLRRFFFPTPEEEFEDWQKGDCARWIADAGWDHERWDYELLSLKEYSESIDRSKDIGIWIPFVFSFAKKRIVPNALYLAYTETRFICCPMTELDSIRKPMAPEIAWIIDRRLANAGAFVDKEWRTSNFDLTEFLSDKKRNSGPARLVRRDYRTKMNVGKFELKDTGFRMLISPLKNDHTLLAIRTPEAGWQIGLEFFNYQKIFDDVADIFSRYQLATDECALSSIPHFDFYLQFFPKFQENCEHAFQFGEGRLEHP